MTLTVGETFSDFVIVGRLGTGEWGEVYLASRPQSSDREALTVLPTTVGNDPAYRARFVREGELAARLSHPNILGVRARGEADDRFWITTEFVDGVDTATMIRDRFPLGLPPTEVVDIVTAVASALDYVHGEGLLHRNVTPGNIRVHQPGSATSRILLCDVGITRPPDDPMAITATNVAPAAVAFAAPEQLTDLDSVPQSDQYALACTAFHLLTGSWPYPTTNVAELIRKHVLESPPSIGARRPEFARLDGVFATALAKDSRARYASCRDFAEALQRGLLAPPDAQGPSPEASAVPYPEQDFAPVPSVRQAGGPTSRASRAPGRVTRKWSRQAFFSGQWWSTKKLLIAALATVGIVAMASTIVFGVFSAFTMKPADPAVQGPTPPPVAAPTTPPVIGKPLVVRPVLDVPLQPRPDQCPMPAPAPPVPAPSPQAPLESCAVDGQAVYQLGPVGVQLNLTSASSAKLPMSEFQTVQMSMDAASSTAFAEYTAANVGKQLAFVRDGLVLAAPTITEPINGQSLQISGQLTAEAAATMAALLRDGS